jgi:hypothetical protein
MSYHGKLLVPCRYPLGYLAVVCGIKLRKLKNKNEIHHQFKWPLFDEFMQQSNHSWCWQRIRGWRGGLVGWELVEGHYPKVLGVKLSNKK